MKKNGIDLGLREAFDDLFSTQEDRDNAKRTFLRDIPVAEISDFPDHPFKVRMDEDMENLVESVKERGVLSPVLVRPLEDGSYQMVSGHRRKRASELAGLETVPCIVRELTDDEATILMVDSNLQRERVLPSERAHAYKMKLEAMKRQGQRTDLTSDPVGWKSAGVESAEIVGKGSGDRHRYADISASPTLSRRSLTLWTREKSLSVPPWSFPISRRASSRLWRKTYPTTRPRLHWHRQSK